MSLSVTVFSQCPEPLREHKHCRKPGSVYQLFAHLLQYIQHILMCVCVCVFPGGCSIPRERGPAAETAGGRRGPARGHQRCCSERHQEETDQQTGGQCCCHTHKYTLCLLLQLEAKIKSTGNIHQKTSRPNLSVTISGIMFGTLCLYHP